MQTLADRLRALMAEFGDRNAKRAAGRTGLGYATIYDILRGKVTDPARATLEKIASSYGVTVGYLVGDEPRRPGDAEEDDADRLIAALEHDVLDHLGNEVGLEERIVAAYAYATRKGFPLEMRHKLDRWRDGKLRNVNAIDEDDTKAAGTADA